MVGPLRTSLTLRAKVALDDAALAMMSYAIPSPSAERWAEVDVELRAAREFAAQRGWLTDPLCYHRTPPPLHRPQLQKTRCRDIEFQHLQFASEYEPHKGEPGRDRWLSYQNNRTAHAWMMKHPGRPRPWLMCIHGYGMGYPFLDLEAFAVRKLFHEMGLNLIFPVLPLHGPRKIAWISGERFLECNWLDTVHAEAQAMWDLRRMIGWIRQHGGTSIGVYGLSLGGYNAALLSTLESKLSCVIAGMPAVDFVRLARVHVPGPALERAKQAGVSWNAIRQMLRPISPLALESKVPRAQRFIFGGTEDHFVPQDQVRALWSHWDRPKVLWYEGSHLSFRWEPEITTFVEAALASTLCARDAAEIQNVAA